MNKECVICYNKFINIKSNDYPTFLEKIQEKSNLTERQKKHYEDITCCMCYDDRFECLTCKNIVCEGCICKMPDNKHGNQLDNYAMFCNGYTEEVYETLTMESTGIITCPICRTIDYRQKYLPRGCCAQRGVLPEEILYDIKKLLK